MGELFEFLLLFLALLLLVNGIGFFVSVARYIKRISKLR
jgi:hypothetical protein